MNRQEAEAMIGQQVSAWTAANGIYAGELIEVLPYRPWRGKVKVTGVQTAACFETARGTRQRRGFRPGDVIEVGGVNIQPTSDGGKSYGEAMAYQLGQYRIHKANSPRDGWWLDKAIAWAEQVIKEETLS